MYVNWPARQISQWSYLSENVYSFKRLKSGSWLLHFLSFPEKSRVRKEFGQLCAKSIKFISVFSYLCLILTSALKLYIIH